MLYGRTDLRDRFVRLAARGRITIAAQAMETAGDTVGRYLLLFALINLGFGITAGLTMWLLGLPHSRHSSHRCLILLKSWATRPLVQSSV